MTETVVIYELNGTAPGTPTSLTGKVGRYCTADLAEPGTNSPCKVPTTDFYYSYWKHHYADVSGSGWTSIRDFYWYCDGNVSEDWGLDSANGGCLLIGHRDTGDNGCPIDTGSQYDQASGTPNTTGDYMGHVSNGHAYYRGQTTPCDDADDHTASAPLLIDSTVYTTAFKSNAWVTQLKIPPTASHGECTSKTFTISYTVY